MRAAPGGDGVEVAAQYMSPVALRVLERALGDFGSIDMSGTAAFLAGLTGMSMAKVGVALIDNAARRLRDGGNGNRT